MVIVAPKIWLLAGIVSYLGLVSVFSKDMTVRCVRMIEMYNFSKDYLYNGNSEGLYNNTP